MRALLKAGANVNASDDAGDTPLHLAASEGRKAVVSELLKEGADPKRLNNHRLSPILSLGIQFHTSAIFRWTEKDRQVRLEIFDMLTKVDPQGAKGVRKLYKALGEQHK